MKDLIYIVLILFLSGVLYSTCSSSKGKGTDELRKEILKRDEMIRHSDSVVSILVRDTHLLGLKIRSLEIIKYVTDRGLQPRIVTEIDIVPKGKTDTLYVGRKGLDGFVTHYPDPSDPFITHTLNELYDGYYTADWRFNPMLVDVVISETTSGMFDAVLKGPDFIVVRNLTVNSLPIQAQGKQKSWGPVVGGGIDYNWRTGAIGPSAQVGYGSTNHKILVGMRMDALSLNYIRTFR